MVEPKPIMLTPKQQEGKQFIIDSTWRCIVGDVAGAGKTYMVLDAIMEQPYYAPTLVICIKVGLPVWKNELKKWYGKDCIIYKGNPKQRKELINKIRREEPEFVVATYPMLQELIYELGPKFFHTLILDEYHMYGLLNIKTKMFETVKSVHRHILFIIGITGTPMRSTPADYYAMLYLLNPFESTFRTYWTYVNEYCIKIKDFFGYTIERFPNNVEKFRTMISKYMISRETDDLPPKLRIPLEVEMTSQQAKAYRQLQEDMMLQGDQLILTPNEMTKILRIRQLLVTPRIFGIEENGGGLNATIEQTELELSNDNPVIIFTPFTDAIPHIETELYKTIPDVKVFKIQGGMTVEEYDFIQTSFQSIKTKNKVLICSIKSGASMTLTDATVCIFLGYEWSAVDNNQAEARSHRKGQVNSVRCFYILYPGTPDDDILDTLNEKQLAMDVCTTPQRYLTKLLKRV